MNWVIVKETDTQYEIRRRGDGKIGHIRRVPDIMDAWSIVFNGASNLNSDGRMSLEKAIGYVRGVERAVQVYGKETGRKTA